MELHVGNCVESRRKFFEKGVKRMRKKAASGPVDNGGFK
jgi:hypothetical protein